MESSKYAEVIPGSEKPGYSPIYRHPKSLNSGEFQTGPNEQTKTNRGIIDQAFQKHGSREFLGTRKVNEDGTAGDFVFKTYAEVQALATKIAFNLQELNLCGPNPDGIRMITNFSKNCEAERILHVASQLINIIGVHLYDQTTIDSTSYILNEVGVDTVATTASHVEELIECKSRGSLVKYVVLLDDSDSSGLESAGFEVYTYSFLCSREPSPGELPGHPDPMDPFMFCYTSGTTGDGKGTVLSHKALIGGVWGLLESDLNWSADDSYLSYLPYAHIYEQCLFATSMHQGAKLGFYQGNPLLIIPDSQALKPTVFSSVPRVYNKIYDNLKAKIDSLPEEKKTGLLKVLEGKKQYFQQTKSPAHPELDQHLAAFKQVIGGNVRIMVTASAPISAEVQGFLPLIFSAPMISIYGQTENCGPALMSGFKETTPGVLGGPFFNLEMRLQDVTEMGYTADDKDEEGNLRPRGELLTRSHLNFTRYYKKPEVTEETMDEDGWIHTGDVFAILPPNNTFKIIDRKKSIFKLAQGEYIQPEKLDGIWILSKFIAQVFTYGDSFQPYLVAIVVPDPDYLKIWAPANGLGEKSPEELVASDELRNGILEDLKRLAAEYKLNSLENIRKIWVKPTPFTVEEGHLTPTMKTKRFAVTRSFKEQIDALYS